jgi:hypothetical protein
VEVTNVAEVVKVVPIIGKTKLGPNGLLTFYRTPDRQDGLIQRRGVARLPQAEESAQAKQDNQAKLDSDSVQSNALRNNMKRAHRNSRPWRDDRSGNLMVLCCALMRSKAGSEATGAGGWQARRKGAVLAGGVVKSERGSCLLTGSKAQLPSGSGDAHGGQGEHGAAGWSACSWWLLSRLPRRASLVAIWRCCGLARQLGGVGLLEAMDG